MNNQFLDYIQTLSIRDKKSLAEKGLKLAEEVGELARVILPYDGAYGTNHRFAEPEDILEESMDSILCCLSIAYHLGYTHEDIEAVMTRKAEKWARLQANEDKAQFPLPYEIHVTVNADNRHWNTIESFEAACKIIGVKPIVLDLQRNEKIVLTDVMTSSKHFGDNKSAYLESQRIAQELRKAGWHVIRIKIETVPWHPAAPQENGDVMPPACYFESHISARISDKIIRPFNARMERFPIHVSQNPLKVFEDGSEIVMITYRSHKGTREQFENVVNQIYTQLNFKYDYVPAEETKVGKPITEFSIYDTRLNHDAKWILGNDGTDTGLIQNA